MERKWTLKSVLFCDYSIYCILYKAIIFSFRFCHRLTFRQNANTAAKRLGREGSLGLAAFVRQMQAEKSAENLHELNNS
jgi:hypothetical protein